MLKALNGTESSSAHLHWLKRGIVRDDGQHHEGDRGAERHDHRQERAGCCVVAA